MARDLGLDEVVDHFALGGDETGWLEQVRDYAAGLRGAAEVAALKRPVPEDAAGAAGQISDLTAVPLGLPEGEVVQRQLERGHADLAGNVAQPRCALVDEMARRTAPGADPRRTPQAHAGRARVEQTAGRIVVGLCRR
jgi:hypothetical protein